MSDILILKGHEVASVLEGREAELMRAVGAAYVTHRRGDSSLPHSTFLLFPHDRRSRIIALPAYLGGEYGGAGMKWVSSFPANIEKGMDRASAVIVLNSTETGRPQAILEGSVISAKRTAASAALAARTLRAGRETYSAGFIGCGLINFEIARFLLAAFPGLRSLFVFDLDAGRARGFQEKCRGLSAGVEVEVVESAESLLRSAPLISLATTAAAPHLSDLGACPKGSVLLHVSLRDLAPEVILACDNVVDDLDHVCRAQTSIHLTEQSVGNRDFVRCTLAEILDGSAPAHRDDESVSVFSPFGLGVLDIAVGRMVYERSLAEGRGLTVDSFLPEPWAP